MENEMLQNELEVIFGKFQTKPILFIGSGISKRYLDLPDWEKLLTVYAEKIDKNRFSLRKYARAATKILDETNAPETMRLPIIASLIKEDYEDKFFDDESFENDIKEDFDIEIKRGESPFKLSLSYFFKGAIPDTPSFEIEGDNFKKLLNKVSNVVTTNYDEFLEKQFNTYNVCIGQNDILNKKLNRIGNIFKIHGSCTLPESLVITKEDYDLFESKQKFLTAKLLTFFMEYPTIFMGYSVGDGNVLSIFKDIKNCLNPEGELELSKKLIFIEFTDDEKLQDIVDIEIAGLRMTKIILKDYKILYKAFEKIIEAIDIEYLKTIEDKVVQLIQTTDKKVARVYADSLENPDFSASQMAILIGHTSSVFRYGYESIRLINICEDILFQTKNYDAKGIIENCILGQKVYFNSSKLPIHKYLSSYTKSDGLDAFFNGKIIYEISQLYSKSEKRTGIYRRPYTELEDIINCKDFDLSKKIYLIYLSLKSLDIKEVKEFIKSIWHQKNEIMRGGKTQLTKIVCAIDLKENT